MGTYESLRLVGIDHVEIATSNADQTADTFLKLGFLRLGSRELRERRLRSILLASGTSRILVTESKLKTDAVAAYVATHGEGVWSIAFRCEDTFSTLEQLGARGISVAEAPKTVQRDFGSVCVASVRGIGDVRFSFLSRQGDLFAEGFDVPVRSLAGDTAIQGFDHVTFVLNEDSWEHGLNFCKDGLGLSNSRDFESTVEGISFKTSSWESANPVLRLVLCRPTAQPSLVQEFLRIHHGPGVQHLALAVNSLVATVRKMKGQGVSFLAVPHSYYERMKGLALPTPFPVGELADLGILAGTDPKGSYLHIFTQRLLGGFFLEMVERKGGSDLGEENLVALAEALHAERARHGVMN